MNPRVLLLLLFFVPPLFVLVAQQRTPGEVVTGVEFGRQVYVAEGCIHCHSQYLRPRTTDEIWWGEAQDLAFSRQQAPVLIGNRRQGPDLMLTGRWKIREWQRRHLIDPRSVVPTSRMPEYAYLFAEGDTRGEALLDYLESLGRETPQQARPVR